MHTQDVPAGWDIRLLGAFEIRAGDRPLPAVGSARSRTLLGYLLLHQESATPRERLAAELWPESTGSQARTNLRHLLHTLRRALPDVDRRLLVAATSLSWRAEPADTLDVAEFDRLWSTTGADRSAALRRAAGLYRGDLLDGVDDEWVRIERDRRRGRLIEVLHELVGIAAGTADAAVGPADTAAGGEVLGDAERLLQLDPLREGSYRLLMRLHAARGDRAAAVRVFHRCSEVLSRELDVRPSAETEAAYRDLLPGRAGTQPLTVSERQPPLVGRDHERGRLASAWRGARRGSARLVLLSGAPGVGKSRLANDFRAWCERQGNIAATASCYATEGPLPYAVVTAWLRSPALRPVLPMLDRERRRDLARLLPELLLDDPDLPPPTPLPEDEQRPRVFDAVVSAFDAALDVARAVPGGPLLLVVDDLHHADRESCRLLHYLLRVRADARLLVVATARRGELESTPVADLVAAVRSRERLDRVEVGLLTLAETGALLARMTGADVPEDDLRHLQDQTGGNALFVVEAVRAGWSAGSTQVPVTPRVRAVLESRIDGLSPLGRDLAAAAAVIGRPFDADLLFTVSRGSTPTTDELVVGLDELWRRGILADRGAGVGGLYDFTHEALRDVALAETGPAARTALHRRVAHAMSGPNLPIGVGAAEIASHHAQGGEPVEAARCYRRAADAAQALYAHAEAIRLLDRAVLAAEWPARMPWSWNCAPPNSVRWCPSMGTPRRRSPRCRNAPGS